MKFTIYKNEVGQLMAMEGHCEFDGVVAKVFDLERSVLEVHKQPETPLEHYWFNLGHQSNKISEENNHLREKLAKAREALEKIASPRDWHIDLFFIEIRPVVMIAREALKEME